MTHIEDITLVAGAGSFENPFSNGTIYGISVTQKGAVALTESLAGIENGNNIDIDSDNVTSTVTVTVFVYGIY